MQVLQHNIEVERMKNSVKHNAGKKLPAQSSESTGIVNFFWCQEQKDRSFLNSWVIRTTLVFSVVLGHEIHN